MPGAMGSWWSVQHRICGQGMAAQNGRSALVDLGEMIPKKKQSIKNSMFVSCVLIVG